MGLRDRFGRTHDDLRVSVTDRCNLRCNYCMPNEPEWFDRAELLTYEEIERVARVAVSCGVSRVRLTGGEPLLRRELPKLVRSLSAIHGIEHLSLTTNGVILARHAEALSRAGLTRVNVSLDTFDEKRFIQLTGRDRLADVHRGLEAAEAAGLRPIKINVVMLRGVNDDEAESMVARGREHGWELRFIEYMPLDNGDGWSTAAVVTGAELRERIGRVWPIEPDEAGDPHAPATRYRFTDGRGTVGFIDSISKPFCGTCSRTRLTADGQFRVCLYDDAETDLRKLVRGGAADADIAAAIRRALQGKGRGGAIEIVERQAALPLARTMHRIGG